MRAPRFQLNLPVEYRPAGGSKWHSGTTLNISRTGVLFRTASPGPDADRFLDAEAKLEIRIVLSGSPEGPGELKGEGQIVRFETRDAGNLALAAEFLDYNLHRLP